MQANAMERTQEETLNGLAMQARTLRLSIETSMWQLARVFSEARELVPYGEWGKWVKENADVSQKTAEDMIAAYRRFGGLPQVEKLGRAKTFKLLPLPEGTVERFLSENDVEAMSTREVQEAVKKARAEAQARIDAAEARVKELEGREPEIPQELIEELENGRENLSEAQENARHFAEVARQAVKEKADLERANKKLQSDIDEQNGLLKEQQEALNRAQEEILNMQSAQARGGAERAGNDELTADALAAAVREFMGACARMPYMGGSFSVMPLPEKNRYGELLRTIEGWCEQSRRALESVCAEGGIVIG